MRPAQKFTFPPHLPDHQRTLFLTEVVNKYQKEASYLRKTASQSQTKQRKLEKEIEAWKEKYHKLKEETEKIRKERNRFKKEVEKLTRTNLRYQVALFDHGNFKHQDKSGEKKLKGGQLGHEDTNRENQVEVGSYQSYPRKRIFAKFCGSCGTALKRVAAFKQKILLDIVINPAIVKLLVESERQWCGRCHKEVVAKDPQTLPFTEYGLNTFMLVLILRFKGYLSMGSISSVFGIAFGLQLSKSEVSNLLKAAAEYLEPKYQELIEAARKDAVVYLDETGWQVKGKGAWLWVMATNETQDSEGVTVYFAAESRGKGIAKELYGNSQAYGMTDGLDSCLKMISQDKHLFCWAHVLRFAYEETVNSLPDSRGIFLRDELVRIYQLKQNHSEHSRDELKNVLTGEMNKLLKLSSDEEAFLKIQHRLKEQKEGLILALLITQDGTNNLAERELRSMVLNKKISFGSDTYQGMATSAVLGSVIQTLGRQKVDLLTEVTLNLQIGIHQRYSQYQHLAYSDSS